MEYELLSVRVSQASIRDPSPFSASFARASWNFGILNMAVSQMITYFRFRQGSGSLRRPLPAGVV